MVDVQTEIYWYVGPLPLYSSPKPPLPFVFAVHLQDFGVDSFNLGDVLQGTVRFTDVTSPIVAAHVSTAAQQTRVKHKHTTNKGTQYLIP